MPAEPVDPIRSKPGRPSGTNVTKVRWRPPRGWGRRPPARPANGTSRPGRRSKSGQRPVHRPRFKTDQRGVHRPRLAAAAGPGAGGERLRALPELHRDRARVRPQRDGDLAGPRRRPRLRRAVREREAVRREAEDDRGARGSPFTPPGEEAQVVTSCPERRGAAPRLAGTAVRGERPRRPSRPCRTAMPRMPLRGRSHGEAFHGACEGAIRRSLFGRAHGTIAPDVRRSPD